MTSEVRDGRIIQLPKIADARGNLTAIEGGKTVPFDIKRVYYLYDVPGGTDRGAHAHKRLEQVIIAVTGSFDVILDDGKTTSRITLRRSNEGLYVPKMTWRDLGNFCSGAVCLVLASEPYDEADYIRNYADFLSAVRRK